MEKITPKRKKKLLKTNVEWALFGDQSINKIHMKGCPFKKKLS
jgi:hypothetical protein